MAYGFQQLDGDGNVLVDSSSPFRRLTQVWDQQVITLGAPSSYSHASTKYFYLPYVTSQWDLDNRYLIERVSGSSISVFTQNEETHRFTWDQYGRIIATFNGTCIGGTLFQPYPKTCTGNQFQRQVFNAYSIGRTFE